MDIEADNEADDQDELDDLDPEVVATEYKRRLAQSQEHSSEWRKEARDLYEFVAGRQWDSADLESMTELGKPHQTYLFSTGHGSHEMDEEIRQQRVILDFLKSNVPGLNES